MAAAAVAVVAAVAAAGDPSGGLFGAMNAGD